MRLPGGIRNHNDFYSSFSTKVMFDQRLEKTGRMLMGITVHMAKMRPSAQSGAIY